MGEEKKHHSAVTSHHAGEENKHHHEQTHETMKNESKCEDSKCESNCEKDKSCCNSGASNDLTKWKVMAGVLLALLIVSVFTNGFGIYSKGVLSKEEASQKALTFINANLMQAGQTAVINSVTEENNLYTMKLQVGAQEFSTYVSKDGQLFFPQGLKIDGTAASVADSPAAPADVPKTAKPEVELYVFTYCPFGLQIEKAAAPVVQLFGNKVDIKIRQIGAMHGAHEEKEAERQLCINKLYPAKFFDYLTLFATDKAIGACNGNDACLDPLLKGLYTKLSFDAAKINSCMTTDGQALYDAEVANARQKGVGGSPTTIINGAKASVARSPEAIKQAICNAFTEKPAECEQVLSTAGASAGFGSSTGADSAAVASCGTQ